MSTAKSAGAAEMGPKSATYFDTKALPSQPSQSSVEGAMPVVNPAKSPANLNNIDKGNPKSSGSKAAPSRSAGQYNDIPPLDSLSIDGKSKSDQPPSGATYGVVPAYNPVAQQQQQAKLAEAKPAASGSAQYASFTPLQGSSPKAQPASAAVPQQGSAAYAQFVPLEATESSSKIESKYVGQIPESPRTMPTLVANSSAPKMSGLGGLGAHMLGNALAASVADDAESDSKDKKKKKDKQDKKKK